MEVIKWYQKTGWIIALLYFFFPVGLFLMWKHAKWKKPIKIIITVFFAFIVICMFAGRDSENEPTTTVEVEETSEEVIGETTEVAIEETIETVAETHIYDDAEIMDIMNGSGTDTLGEFSLVIADSSEVTDEVLTDWYFNHIVANDYNWGVILYSDSTDNEGVFANQSYLQKGVLLSQDDSDGTYVVSDSSNEILYYPTNDETLELWD